MMNPTLSDLIGGIQTVTLGDEEAKRRGTQKSILERMSLPTFDIVVEIQDWDRVAIHPDVSEAVDAILRGQPVSTEIRWLDETGKVRVERQLPATTEKAARPRAPAMGTRTYKLYLFGVNRGRVEQIAKEEELGLEIVDNLSDASLFVISKSYYRRRPLKVREAETSGVPIYVLKSNTPPQIRQMLNTIYPPASASNTTRADRFRLALSEAQAAIQLIKDGEVAVELSPQSAYIRRLQHLIAQRGNLASHSLGKDPERRVRIYKEEAKA